MTVEADQALTVLRARGVSEPVAYGLIMGTGLASVAEAIDDPVSVPYGDLPGFPAAGVSGHAGRLVVGTWEGQRVAVFQGRAHYYEHGDASAMRMPLETLKGLGAHSLLVTNSAGSLNPDWPPGTLALIGDHINLSGANPLIGMGGNRRFVNLAEAYDAGLRRRLHAAAETAGIAALKEGIYMWLSGPSFETPAEIRMCQRLGGDLVGMSTVPEVILARYLDLRVAGVSVVTNFGTGLEAASPTHTETKEVALKATHALTGLLRAFLRGADNGDV